MSCPDWRRLDASVRDAPGKPGARWQEARWQEALRHLDGGCPRCWQEAVAVDPTLIFRRLPAPELGPAEEADEVAAARLAVAAMRTASRAAGSASAIGAIGYAGSTGATGSLGSIGSLGSLGSRIGRRAASAFRQQRARWALAAGLTAMALTFGASHGWHGPAMAGSGAAAPGSPAAASMPGPVVAGPGWAAAPSGLPVPAASRPSIEGLSRPRARVYQIDSPHMSVVMIVDSKLDV
jgi:hypothetical protein